MQKLRTRHFSLVLAGLIATVGLSACGEPMIDEEQAQGYAEHWVPTVEESLRSRAELAAGSEAVKAHIQEAAREEERQVQREEPPFSMLLERVYADDEFAPKLTDDEGLSTVGEAVYETLLSVEDHGLEPAGYGLEAIDEALGEWEARRGRADGFEGLAATDEDRQEAVAWLVEQPQAAFSLSEENYDDLTQGLIDDEGRGQRLVQALEEYQQKRAEIAQTQGKVEHLLGLGLARYSWEQRHFRTKEIFVHPRHWDLYNEADVEGTGPRPDGQKGGYLAGQIWRDAAHLTEEIAEEKGAALRHDKIVATVAEVLASEEPADALAAIAPQQPQYAGLVAEYQRYQRLVEEGGWPEVERRDNLRPGQSHPVVAQLKERLKIEGYLADGAAMDDTFDDDLEAAIEAYQTTHQMRVTGRPHSVFWYSLNVPAERRLAQIELNIDRWRHSNISHELDQYVFVNIPGSIIQMWKDQERVEQFATVVGNNDKALNPLTNEEAHSNRTPTMAAYIDRVIYNPYWNVTERIRAEETIPAVAEFVEGQYAVIFERSLAAQAQAAEAEEEQAGTLVSAGRSFIAGLTNGGDEAANTEAVVGEAAAIDTELSGGDTDGSDPSTAEAGEGQEGEPGQMALLQELPKVEGFFDSDREFEEEEREELKRRFEEQEPLRQAARQEWTYSERVYNEELERHENRRFFHSDKLRQIEAIYGGDSDEALEALHSRFPYLDWETGEVDVEQTIPELVPGWYVGNGYEVVRPGHPSWEYTRMLPGPGNALGKVKIIFPNYDNIYLHDTPAKSLFSEPVRGFSHGCIRLQRPLQLAESLLIHDGQEVDVNQIMEDEEYAPIFLNRQVPVFLEYYTVTVDDEGRANFLADIYDYDDEYLAEYFDDLN